MKNRCEGREGGGMGLKCVLKYNKIYLIYILDRINRIIWISFLTKISYWKVKLLYKL